MLRILTLGGYFSYSFRLGVSFLYVRRLVICYVWGLVFHTFEVRDSYVFELVFFIFGFEHSYRLRASFLTIGD